MRSVCKLLWILLWLAVFAGGFLLRAVGLNNRPMHTDESVHAYKFKALLEDGFYRYDPHEYHGPVLNYLTLATAYARGERTFTQIDETTLRLVPAIVGTLLILTPLFFTRAVGARASLFTAVLIAFSPAFVYYSRYYIQEMLLVFFTACFLGSAWQYTQRHTLGWMLSAGVFLGLMHASKETFVLSVAAAAIALLIMTWRCKLKWSICWTQLTAGAIAFAVTSFALFSSFGANPQGLIDSFATYGIWMQRAGGQSVHVHPWYYYLDLLTWMEFFEPITWNEDGIVALAVLGIVYLLAPKSSKEHPLACFFGFFTLVLTAVYWAIPYKTPWSMLSFLFGMTLVGGWFADCALQSARYGAVKAVIVIVLLVYGLVSPLAQSNLLAFDYASDPANPYVYAHTSDDICRMVREVKQAVYASGQGTAVQIHVCAEKDDYWPWPWYLREFSNVGYWSTIDPSVVNAPIILAQARLEQPLLRALYSVPAPGQKHLYLPLFDSALLLRPGVPWQGYIRKELWDKMQPRFEQPDAQEKDAFMNMYSAVQQFKNLHKFSHQAMNTTFGLFIQHPDATYAANAARAAFKEADRLEGLLSRFIENSDVSRINAAAAEQVIAVDEDTMQCLLKALHAFELTGGAFDINYASGSTPSSGEKSIPFGMAVQLYAESLEMKLNARVRLDLGGIGKGYAADKMVQVLKEWSVAKALVYAGASSVAVMEPPDETSGWPVTISEPQGSETRVKLFVANEVLSSSGIAKGSHIVDPGSSEPANDRLACWVRLPTDAALADALSTAGMIMPIEEVRQLQSQLEGCSIVLAESEDGQAKWVEIGDRFRVVP